MDARGVALSVNLVTDVSVEPQRTRAIGKQRDRLRRADAQRDRRFTSEVPRSHALLDALPSTSELP